MTVHVLHFDKLITEISRVLTKSPGLEPDDKAKLVDARRLFERLEIEYHGGEEDSDEEG
jgi:hypothetical protein